MPNKLFIILRILRDSLKIPFIITNYLYDLKRYLLYSSSISDNEGKKLEAKIIVLYHVIEKGLSMPEPRKGFGKSRVDYLIILLKRYEKTGRDMSSTQIQAALQVLTQYFDFNYDINDSEILRLKNEFLIFKNYIKQDGNQDLYGGGILHVNKKKLLENSKKSFKLLAENRHSIRKFSDEKVELELLFDSIKIAQKTPSVCNRQSSRVYIIEDKEKIKEVLQIQNGNRGFGHLIDKVLIVTSDLNVFNGVTERNQTFIDGGMYAMSLLYALHSNGLGTCPLNWAVDKNKDIKLRRITGIKSNENIMLLIGVGHLPEELSVAASKRKNISEIVTVI